MEEITGSPKLTIYVAETGHSFTLNCPNSTTVHVVQTCLISLADVPPNDQLLICDDIRLEPQRSLASYRLPAEGRNVFLYNRARLLADASPPPPEQIQVKDLVIPSSPLPPLNGHPLEKVTDPAVKALPSYERQFRFHFEKGLGIFNATHERFEVCGRLLHEKQVQGMAIDTAKRNMDHYYNIIDLMYSDFMKHFNRQQKQHADLLANLDRDMERLRRCRLHPGLVADNRQILLDCIDVSTLHKQAEFCGSSLKQFHGKVMQLKVVYVQLQKNVQDLSHIVPTVNIGQSEKEVTEHAGLLEEEKSIMQSLSKDMTTVKKLVDECMSNNFSLSMRPLDAVSAFGPMYHVHVNDHLPKMEACYSKMEKLLQSFKKKKHEMSTCVHKCMQRVAALQSNIRDVRNQLAAFKEAMSRQEEIFGEVKLVRQIGPAYRACLAEVVRRKASMKLYMGQAGQLAEKMARIREAEVSRREEFLKGPGGSLAQDILAALGLFGAPSQCVVNIEPYDASLLNIDIRDIEKFAPESLFGSHLRGLSGSYRSQAKSMDSSSSRDLGTVDDGITDEIAGTSKLEVENAWLKAELASKVAISYSLDFDFEALATGNESDDSKFSGRSSLATQKTVEALALKDDYAKQLKGMLKSSQQQCDSYERRIRELEQRLAERHEHLHQPALMACEVEDSEVSGVTGEGGMLNRETILEPMDDGVSRLNEVYAAERLTQTERLEEGGDESTVVGASIVDDVPMSEREDACELMVKEVIEDVPSMGRRGVVPSIVNNSSDTSKEATSKEAQLLSLQDVLLQKTSYCLLVEEKLEVALKDVNLLKKELDEKSGLLSECQYNCAELETSLHLAREESRIKQCFADRKVAEYNLLRASSVKLRGLIERLRHCVSTSATRGTDLSEALRALAASLSSNDAGDEGTTDFCSCIRAIAEKVGWLAQQHVDLLERCSLVETSKGHLATELEAKVELLKNQYAKRKLDKQVNKEKICYTKFQVHELAMFAINAAGYYEAVNRGCPNYYLSDESVALFHQHLPEGQPFIIGQIVHIDRNVARPLIPVLDMTGSLNEVSGSASSSSGGNPYGGNPYGLPYGTVYFVVTLAMIPDRMPSLSLKCAGVE